MIITKRAADLQPGDIIKKRNGDRRVVLRIVPVVDPQTVHFIAVILDSPTQPMGTDVWGVDTQFDVEAPALTPAQQHAAEMLELTQWVAGYGPEHFDHLKAAARVLVDKINPPVAPTVRELAAALDAVMTRPSLNTTHAAHNRKLDEARELIRRARRAGQLG